MNKSKKDIEKMEEMAMVWAEYIGSVFLQNHVDENISISENVKKVLNITMGSYYNETIDLYKKDSENALINFKPWKDKEIVDLEKLRRLTTATTFEIAVKSGFTRAKNV